jgi:integrase
MKWDKGVDYEYAYKKILNHFLKYNYKISSCYDAILLIQLRNGLRISEAVRSFKEFLRTKRTEFEIPVSKKKKPELRLVVIPKELILYDHYLSICRDLLELDDKTLVNRLKVYCRYTYNFNTHSLRYAFITYLLRQGVNPAIISKITRHSKLDFILSYTQEKSAQDILRSL